MDDGQERRGKIDGLRFFGTITASTTHELRNIVATIEQVTGLLEDYVAGLEAGQGVDPQLLMNVRERIVRNTNRARSTIDRLNAFAHTVDTPVSTFDLKEALTNLLGISERLASLKKVTLVPDYPPDELILNSYPFALQYVLFNCLRGFWDSAPENSKVKLKLAQEDGWARIEITGPAWSSHPSEDATREHLAAVLADIAGELNCSVEGDSQTFVVKIPLST